MSCFQNIPSGLGRREDEVSDDKPFYSVERQISPLGVCYVDDEAATPGASKIDHENAVELTTLPVDSKLSSLILSADDCDYVDSFVAMSLSNDGESVEVKYILRKVLKLNNSSWLHLLTYFIPTNFCFVAF